MPTTVRDLGADDVDALQRVLESVPDYAERITGYPPASLAKECGAVLASTRLQADGERKPYRYDHTKSTVALWERPI